MGAGGGYADGVSVRVLTQDDLVELNALVDLDPLVNLFVAYRLETTRLQARWFGGQMWGYYDRGELVSACHVAANLVPVQATADAIDAFAERVADGPRTSSSIVGPADAVRSMWERLQPFWGRARSPRLNQPFLAIEGPPQVRPDPRVRRVLIDELDLLYPACVAMFTEEVGESPERPGGHSYRARVAQLISRGWAFAIIEDDQVLFKAEVGAATAHGCQIQGVYVHPERRGEGLGQAGMAAVIEQAQIDIAPVVTLYVNAHNIAALRAYANVGLVQTDTFASILF